MKVFVKSQSDCSGVRSFALFPSNGRALFGVYWGYFSIFWRNFATDIQLIDASYLQSALFNCDIDQLNDAKFQSFINEPLSFWQRVKYYSTFRWVKAREYTFRKNIEQLKNKYGQEG